MAARRKPIQPLALTPDPEADYTAETQANFERALKSTRGPTPSITVHEIGVRPGTAQVGIWTGKGTGLTICVHGRALRGVIATLTAIAAKGGA
jgi:hypothetical protein